MMMQTRERVSEHRITRHWAGFIIRYWIESSSLYGGTDFETALDDVRLAEEMLAGRSKGLGSDGIAFELLELIPSANSVEVCDADGNGTAVHRDWP